MLNQFNQWLQRWLPILTPLSLVIGVVLHGIGDNLYFLVPWLFAFMTFAGSLGMNFNEIKLFAKHPMIILISIAFLHFVMPAWAYFLSTIFFEDYLLIVGFVIAVTIPTGVTSVIWVTITRGNLSMCLAIVLIDTLLAPLMMPAIVHVVAGEKIAVSTSSLIFGLLWMIVLPTLAGILLNRFTKGTIQTTLGPKLAPFAKLCLIGIVVINGSTIAPYVKKMNWELVGIIALVFFIAATGYALALAIGHLLWNDATIATTFMFLGGMRNIAVGVVIATTYFPPKVAMPVVFGMLFQQVLASLYSKVADWYRRKVTELH